MTGDYLYVGVGPSGIRILDTNQFDFAAARVRVIGPEGEDDTVNGITIDNDTAYLAVSDGLMRRLDISNPLNPSFMPSDSTIALEDPLPGKGQDVIAQGNIAYLANIDGLKTISLSDLGDSVVTGFDLSPGPSVGVAVDGNLAYIADRTVGLGVYDVSDPRAPDRIGWLGTDGEVANITISGSNAYLCDTLGGFHVLGLGAGVPTRLGYTNTPGAANDVVIEGNYAYVANSGGLQIIDISDPAMPNIVGSVLTLGDAVGVAVNGTTAYVLYNGLLDGWSTPVIGSLTTPCPSSNLVQEFEWEWDFGDGTDPLTHDSDPAHLYMPTMSVTDYLVKLRVTERQTDVSRSDSLIVSVPNY
jgi:hypothetical protein